MSDAINDLVEALQNGEKIVVQNLLKLLDNVKIADFFSKIKNELRIIFAKEYIHLCPEVLIYLTNDLIEEILDNIGFEYFAQLVKKLQADEIVDVLEDLDEHQIKELLEFFPGDMGRVIREILSYPEESAGRLIHKDFIVAPESWTIERVLQFIRMQKNLPKHINEIFVVDDFNKPIGSITLNSILRAKSRMQVKDVMEKDIKIIKTGEDQEDVAQIFKDYSLNCAPVVDEFGKIIGMISVDDVVSVITEEAEEDILHVGRVSGSDLNVGVLETVLRRIKWLIITFFSINISSYLIGFFENTLQKNVELAILMPVVAAMGGNAGIQASTIAVRAIITKQLNQMNATRLFIKEIWVGLCNGIIMSLLITLVIALRFHELKLELTFTIATTTVFVLATSVGAAIPFLIARLGGDPALSSSIVTSSFTDILAFSILLSVAALVFAI